jgi:hypothetical protein
VLDEFDKFATFDEAWEYIKKLPKKDVLSQATIEAIVNRGVLIRNILLYLQTSHQPINLPVSIYTQSLHETESDYLFYLLLNLIISCPVFKISSYCNLRLYDLLESKEFVVDEQHQQFVLDRIDKIKAGMLHKLTTKLKLAIQQSYFLERAKNHIKAQQLDDAAIIINDFKL